MKVRGVREVSAGARAARRELDHGQAVVLEDLATIFREGEAQIFRTYGSAIGERWRPLADSTAKQRLRLAKRFSLSISARDPRLVLFGDMRAALTEPGGAHHIRITGSKIEISIDGTAVNRHNRATGAGLTLTKKGTRRKARGRGGRYPENIIEIHDEGDGVPRRRVVGVPPGAKRRMDARVKRYLDNITAALASGL